MSDKTLVAPTPQKVRHYADRFDADPRYGAADRALTKLFAVFRSNSVAENVLLKVVTLNRLYSTGILDVVTVAEHVRRIGLDALLDGEDLSAVERIARVQLRDQERRFYSFASKYCSWHKPEVYPIYDSTVDDLLWRYRQQDGFDVFHRRDLKEYARYTAVLERFRQVYGLENVGFKQLDKFLWMYGRTTR